MLEVGLRIPVSNLQRPVVQTGAVAQLGEHLLCKEGVRSSSLLGSTNTPLAGTRNVAVHCRTNDKQGNTQRTSTQRPMRNLNRAIE